MLHALSRRLLLSVLPALLLAALASVVIWGDDGLLVRHQLQGQLEEARGELARLDGTNERLLRDLRAIEQDPVVLERTVADELHWARPGDVLVRFDADPAGTP